MPHNRKSTTIKSAIVIYIIIIIIKKINELVLTLILKIIVVELF